MIRLLVLLLFLMPAASWAQPIDPDLDLPVQRPEPDPPASPTPQKEGSKVTTGPTPAPLPAPAFETMRTMEAPPPAPPPEPKEPPITYPIFFGQEIAADKFILVADVSGSMFENRIKLLRAEFKKLVDGMSERTIFDVVTFTNRDHKSEFQVLWPRVPSDEHEGMRKATRENKAAAIAFVNAPTFGGNTPTFQGVKAGLEFLKNNRIVLLTDGGPSAWVPWKELEYDPYRAANMVPGINGGPPENMAAGEDDAGTGWSIAGGILQHEYMIRRENYVVRPGQGARPARIDVIGILDPVNEHPHGVANQRWFCRNVAKRNGGFYHEVDTAGGGQKE